MTVKAQHPTVIPYGSHYIDDDDIAAVTDVLRHGRLTQGPSVEAFESAVAAYVGAKYAVAVSSGTAALHLAALAAELGPGKLALTSPISFVATANAVLYTGAQVDFVDVDAQTINMDPKELEMTCERLGRIHAILPVHFAGLPADMKKIRGIADRYKAIVIEDACHALGAVYTDGQRVGSCAYSDMTVFSFHPVKAITTGEGGMITTNSRELYERLLQLRVHGVEKSSERFIDKDLSLTGGRSNPWSYEMQTLGYNYRLSDLQCALGLSQLKKLDRFLAKRREQAHRYDQAFRDLPAIRLIQTQGRALSAHHLFVLRIDYPQLSLSRAELMHWLAEHQIGSQVHYIPIHRQPYYQRRGFKKGQFSNAEQYYAEALSLPLFYALTEDEQEHVIACVKDLIAQRSLKK